MPPTPPAFEVELTRVIEAPRARVYAAWTTPQQLAQWFAPQPYQLLIHAMDVRPGGRWHRAMRAPDGTTHAFSGTDRALVPPSTLTWTGEFATGPADQLTTVITLEERGRHTQVHARQTFHVMTPEIAQATQGAQQGWTMTLDPLAACCAAP